MKDKYITCNDVCDFKKYAKVGSEIILVGKLGMTVYGIYLCLDYSEKIINYIDGDNVQRADLLDSIKEIKVKLEEKKEDSKMNDKENIYLDKEIGIRKDYLYKITIEDVGVITGEILNFNGCTYVIKSYKNKEFNHYIVKYKNILDLHPVMTIEQYNKKQINL